MLLSEMLITPEPLRGITIKAGAVIEQLGGDGVGLGSGVGVEDGVGVGVGVGK